MIITTMDLSLISISLPSIFKRHTNLKLSILAKFETTMPF